MHIFFRSSTYPKSAKICSLKSGYNSLHLLGTSHILYNERFYLKYMCPATDRIADSVLSGHCCNGTNKVHLCASTSMYSTYIS